MRPRAAALVLVLLALTPRPARAYPTVEGHPARYVIFTADALAPSFQPLADWKTQTGLPAVVRRMSDAIAAHPVAFDDAERLRLDIRDAWLAGAQWVLLGGGAGVVPTRYAHTTFFGGADLLTDLYFQCLDGNWDANGNHVFGEGYLSASAPGDSADLVADVWLGRAPVATPLEAQRFVAKTLQYERTPAGDYEHLSLECADVLFPLNWTPGSPTTLDGADLVEPLLPWFDLHPSVHVARLYENYTEPSRRPGALPETRAAVLDSLNRGSNQTLIIGHGAIHTLSVGTETLDEADFLALGNGNRLESLRLIGDSAAQFDSGGIAIAALLAPGGGAASVIGSSAFDFPTAERTPLGDYYRLIYQDSVNAQGEANARSMTPILPFTVFDSVNRWTVMTQPLLGDPDLRTWTGPPRTLTVGCPPEVVVGDTSLDVTVFAGLGAVRGARVAARAAGQFLGVSLTDPSGFAHVRIQPTASGSFLLTVTGYDARPFQTSIPIVEPPTPTLAALVRAEARFDRVVLTGIAPAGSAGEFALERARSAEGWVVIGPGRPDGAGALRFEDRGVEPGATYRYRLAIGGAAGPTWSAELAVTVPPRPRLAVRALSPQPASGAPEVELTLAASAPARLELIDVAGRRLAARDLAGLDPGAHTMRLDEAAALAPGLYWLRLVQGADRAHARLVLAR